MKKLDLSTLPLNIQKVNKKWYKNTTTGKFIPAGNIANHLPKTETDDQQILQKRWDLRY